MSGLSDEQQAAAAVGHLRASGRRELRTCHYTPPGRPCAVTELLSSVAAAIVRVRAELAVRPAGLVMTRKAIGDRAYYARRRLARAQEART